ncbi:DUF2982 domain-containing protein [Rheinheimera sp. MMS21-TC3]|uniref:DUF2982 domain-containing protein n=1 Tax=Rheinheimera sp. MMS21-TC3 TaxID=3072790 RepID=UPI0028C4D7DB|nr:DUF2982 domain-containing protein [Rheinheimera sp. MMS21-TC3]WNO61399.1 DUF2982 domain-containing protein [Rheinheimera sp. MMS21-TC3]
MVQQFIENSANKGGARLILISSISIILLLIFIFWQQQFSLIVALALIVAGLGIFTGWAKLSEPRYLLQLDDKGVHYYHRKGSWLLPWSSFLYSGVPEFNNNDLAFIGFKVTHYDQFLQHLPLRLAVRIMTEQRTLYLDAVRQNCASGQCGLDSLSEVDNFVTSQQVYNGIKAAFAWRMQRLANSTGFELLIAINVAKDDAVTLCKTINAARLRQL